MTAKRSHPLKKRAIRLPEPLIFQTTIRDLSSQGLGVADHPSGLAIFVEGVFPGDKVSLKLTQVKKRFGFAKLIEIIESSPQRVPKRCPHQGFERGQCGACLWMGLDYSAQLKYKQNFLEQQLARRGLEVKVLPIWSSPKEFGYRNRAQLKTDGLQVGFVSRGSKQLAPITDCIVLKDTVRKKLNNIITSMPMESWKPKGKFSYSLVNLDEASESPSINERLSFQQANDAQNERMKSWLYEEIHKESGKVLELFCGSGNFTEVLLKNSELKVHGVEIVSEALVELNKISNDNLSFSATNLFEQSNWDKIYKEFPGAEILLMDPPREGFQQVSDFITELEQLRRIIYISCDGATFARDVDKLVQKGWRLEKVQPLDQFPQTPHVEILASLVRI